MAILLLLNKMGNKADSSLLGTLLRLLRRDGFAFFAKCLHFAFSPRAWRWLLRGGAHDFPSEVVVKSPWFDREWMVRNYPELRDGRIAPADFYLSRSLGGWVRPGPDFPADEYIALHPDLIYSEVKPLVNWETIAQDDGSPLFFLDTGISFPDGAAPFRKSWAPHPPKTRRTAVFAAFSADGRIPERNLFYLRGLREVADNIVFVSSSPIFPEEATKIEGLVSEILCEPHGEYDFGSYRRGRQIALERGLLDAAVADELILCNDSCYGPVFPFGEAFTEMASRPCDFWGLTANIEQGCEHLQTYFLVFRRTVLDDSTLGAFLGSVQPLASRNSVVIRYEARFTESLRSAGFSFDSFIPRGFCRTIEPGLSPSPVQWPAKLMRKWRMPLVKVKAFGVETMERPQKALSILRREKPELARLVSIRKPLRCSAHRHAEAVAKRKGLPSTYPAKAGKIRGKAASGLSVRCVFFAPSLVDFTARPLFEAMLADRESVFTPAVCVVPDIRDGGPCRDQDGDENTDAALDAAAEALSAIFGDDAVMRPRRSLDGVWPDVLADADIAVYPSGRPPFPFPYCPYWAIGRRFLPVVYAGDPSVAPGDPEDIVFWKTFLERGGDNAATGVDALREIKASLAMPGPNGLSGGGDDAP